MTRGRPVPSSFRALGLVLSATLAIQPFAIANPQGGSVRQGQVRIQGGDGRLVIRQQSRRAVIDWESFSIGTGEITRFRQPDAAAAVLNRVRGDSASRIEGMLRANGQVYLINPNGILVGPDGTVDVAGFVASTLETDPARFMQGGNQRFAGSSDAAIVNLGSISALDGDVILMAGSVLNEGAIRAPRGTAALAAGNDILLSESGSERVFVRGSGGSQKAAGVTNTGEIEANIAELKAHGGNVYGMAVKNEGRVAATGVTRSGGQIFLSAGGGKVRSTGTLTARKGDGSGGRIAVDSGGGESRTEIGGTVDASGIKGGGGEIVILGNGIELFEGALILNDGATMGGSTYIGGGKQGRDPALANAENVIVGRDAILSARALESGQGGRIVVYAGDRLDFGGTLSVAGSAGGRGGFAELSGAREVFIADLGQQVDLGAGHGPAGTLLLDPINVSVISGINNGIVSGTTITDGSIVNFLSSTGNLIIDTSGTGGAGDISVAGNTNIVWSSANSLSFVADRDFLLSGNALIESTGSGSFSATAARSIQLMPTSAIRVKDGSLTLSANGQSTPTSGTFAGVKVDGATVESTGAGILSVNGRGGDVDGDNVGVFVTGGGRIVGGSAAIHFVSGTGGAAPGSGNDGIRVIGAGSEISTNGGNLVIEGTGGGSASVSGMNSGVFVNDGGLITTGSGGSLDLTGTGGGGGGDNNKGVWVSQAVLVPGTISSGGGAVTVTGTGGGTGPGVYNHGVMVAGSNALLSTGGVSLTITATGGANTQTESLSNSGTISTPGNETLTLVTDSFDNVIGNVSSGTGTTLIRPRTADFSVSLGGADVAGTALGLSDTELDRISAGLLEIGNASTGMIVVNAALTHGNDLSLVSGMNVTIGQAVTMDPNKSFSVNTVDPADGSILLSSGSAQLSATGSGTVTLVAARNLTLTNGSGISSANGNIVLSANAAGNATGGFSGVWLDGATVSSGDGSVFLTGKGGKDIATAGNHGVRVLGGSQVSSTGLGSVSINGEGGLGTFGNMGVSIVGSGTSVRTASGLLQIVGTGASGAVGNDNDGISLNAGALVESIGGNVLVQGTAGGGTSGRNGIAVIASGTIVKSEYGTVTLEGTGGSSNLASNIGVGLYGGGSITTGYGSGAVSITGDGGAGGFIAAGASSVMTQGGNLLIDGTANSGDHTGLVLDLANLSAGGGTLHLRGLGSGSGGAISSTDSGAMIGGFPGTVILESLGGSVGIQGRIEADRLQVRDSGGLGNVGFSLLHSGNDVDRINAIGSGSDLRIGSLVFRDSDGFEVAGFLGGTGIDANGNIELRSFGGNDEALVAKAPVASHGGSVELRGRDVVVDGANVSSTSAGAVTLNAFRAVLIQGGAQLSVEDGDLSVSGNQDETPDTGFFTGVTVLGSRLQSLGQGGIFISGAGGTGAVGTDFLYAGFSNPGSNGVRLAGGTEVFSYSTTPTPGSIHISGQGGGGASDSNGILMTDSLTSVQSALAPIYLWGNGGGQSTGARNRGVLISGAQTSADDVGSAQIYGNGGDGYDQIDGIQLENGASVSVEDGTLSLYGQAGGTLGIGVMATLDSGDLRVNGSGNLLIEGTGIGASGVQLGNTTSIAGGSSANSVTVTAFSGNLDLSRPAQSDGNLTLGAPDGRVHVQNTVTSASGDVFVDGLNLKIDAPVSATLGDLTLRFGQRATAPVSPMNGLAEINQTLTVGGNLRFIGGEGAGDHLSFAGYLASPIELDAASLSEIELVTGTSNTSDRVIGANLPTVFNLTGANAFDIGGSVFFDGFENLLGGSQNDLFRFTGNATLDGDIDGGGGTNRLDYLAYGSGVALDLESSTVTGIGGNFSRISNFGGSSMIDTVTGPDTASVYQISGISSFQLGSTSVSDFENLIGGSFSDRFLFLPGGRITGTLEGGPAAIPANDILDYSQFGRGAWVDLSGAAGPRAAGIAGGFTGINRFVGSATGRDLFRGPSAPTQYLISGSNRFGTASFDASGFENLEGGEAADTFTLHDGGSLSGRIFGGAGIDTLDYSIFGRGVTVNVGLNTATGLGGFTDIERVVGSTGNDRFRFSRQQTIGSVDGGDGTDLVEINDSNLPGDHTYHIREHSVSRNPLYALNNVEAVRLFLGPGNNTVNSDFHAFTQFVHAGDGFNTLNLPGVNSLNQGNPIRNVYHYNFDAPRPGGEDRGDLLQLEVNPHRDGPGSGGAGTTIDNRFTIVDPTVLSQQIGAVTGAFAASIAAQASLVVVDNNPYLVFRPFSLDGSGLTPSILAIDALNQSLGVESNLELAAAIGYTGPIFLFNPDGAHGLDLSGAPVDPAILTLLQESLSLAAARELSAALGLNLTASLTPGDGILPTSLDDSVPGQPTLLLLTEHLGDPAFAELNAAIGGN